MGHSLNLPIFSETTAFDIFATEGAIVQMSESINEPYWTRFLYQRFHLAECFKRQYMNISGYRSMRPAEVHLVKFGDVRAGFEVSDVGR